MITKIKIKIGNKYNKLIVLSFAYSKNNRKYWNCKCDCGKTTVVATNKLTTGHTKSCGCYSREKSSENGKRGINLVGQKFNRLLVIEELEDRNEKGNRLWLCLCNCGEIKKVSTHDLKSNNTKSCGCLNKDRIRERNIEGVDWTNKIVGKLLVIKDTGKIDDTFNRLWLCLCDCGNYVEIPTTFLQQEHKKSCGCLRNPDLIGFKTGKLTVLELTDQILLNGSRVWLCQCECGNQTYLPTSHLYNNITRSCGCLKQDKSAGEMLIDKYLFKHNYQFEKQFRFQDCRDCHPLPFDFCVFIDNVKYLIEYNGIQHYQAIDWFGGEEKLKYTQLHDKIKNDYCLVNKINILTIPYWEIEFLETHLANYL